MNNMLKSIIIFVCLLIPGALTAMDDENNKSFNEEDFNNISFDFNEEDFNNISFDIEEFLNLRQNTKSEELVDLTKEVIDLTETDPLADIKNDIKTYFARQENAKKSFPNEELLCAWLFGKYSVYGNLQYLSEKVDLKKDNALLKLNISTKNYTENRKTYTPPTQNTSTPTIIIHNNYGPVMMYGKTHNCDICDHVCWSKKELYQHKNWKHNISYYKNKH